MDSAVVCNNCGLPYTLSEEEEEEEVVVVGGRLPHVLFCGHIFCTECLHSLQCPQDNGNILSNIICPDCKMSSEIGEEGVDGLQVDSRIVGLIYTSKMNSKRRHTAHRTRGRAARSSHEELAEEGPDVGKVLNEALCRAKENLKSLDNLHQSLFTGIQSQLNKEKTRVIKEIDECVEKAITVLQRRRNALVSDLSCLEELFSPGREECQKLQMRRKELHTAIQKAQHVCQVPLLETYCHLEEILETLQSPLDTESYDMSCLTLRSGLRCILHEDYVKSSLEFTDSPLMCEETAIPVAAVRAKGSWEHRGHRDGPQAPIFPRTSSRKRIPPTSPDVIIEEIIEEPVAGGEEEVKDQKPKHPQRQRVARKNRKAPTDRTAFSQTSQELVAVTHIINPSHFYVRYVMERKAGVFLSKKINSICSGVRSHFTGMDQIKTGALVFVKRKDNVWCRAEVRELIQKGCLECVTQCSASDVAHLEVFFLDYGYSKGLTISGDDVAELNERMRKADSAAQADLHHWAPQAIRCSLKGIIPSNLVKGWCREASEEMKHVIDSSVVKMQVLGEERDTLLVDLKKISMNTTLSLSEHLVFMELARFYSPQLAPGGSKTLQFYQPVYPILNTELNAVVSHVNTPSDFYIQLVDNMEFLLLNTQLQNCYGLPGAESDLQVYSPVLSQACVALYDNKDWCRALVTGFPGGRMVEVQYVDFGNTETLSVKDLRQIKDEFFALPAMALWCSLDSVMSAGRTWSEESINVFRELTDQKLVTVVAKKLGSSTVAMPVRLYEVTEDSTARQSSIGDYLVKRTGFAKKRSSLTLPAVLKDVKVRVTHVTAPGNIFVQLLQYDPHLKRIHDVLKNEYSKSEPQEIVWKAEMSCAANVNGVWERGKVCSVSSSDVAEVLRCDFGNKVKVDVSDLRPLLPDLIGSFLLECRLTDIRPAPAEPDTSDDLGCSSSGIASLEECKESNTSSAPSHTHAPKPAPRRTPPPENVSTQAYLPPELPPCGDIHMSVSAVSDDGVIYAMTLNAVCEFERLQEQLQQHIKTLPRQKHYNWKNVLGCAVMGSDMLWYRGEVQEVIGGYVKVRYVDQGVEENIPVCHVYPVVLCENVPQLCMPCRISGVCPVGDSWQCDAVALMKESLLGRVVSVHVIELPEDPHGLVNVEMILDGMPLSRIMVHHQHATFNLPISPEDCVVKPPVPDLDDWDLNTEGLEEPQAISDIYTDHKLPDVGKSCWVKIKHIRTPNEVFLSVIDTPGCDQESLDEALGRVNRDIDDLPLLKDFPFEATCLAEYSDGKYYRAKLLGFSELNPSTRLLVRHVDFGSDDILPLSKLRCLPKTLLCYPCEAVCVQLAGFKPSHLCQESARIPYRPEWSMKAMMEMIDLLHGKLRAVLTAVEPHPTVMLYNADGTLVHTPLVEKGLADYE
ncbi:hypothetical protein HF521_016704 [Silurus meridionalis]|uniref:RING finger protein 17 n=1 Tax=Silurus meridionalis TaxID=175797 RepID=A0A8T0BS35_SILME|nr:hypothetical protein HF521_016704 [Silurus meridionalis]